MASMAMQVRKLETKLRKKQMKEAKAKAKAALVAKRDSLRKKLKGY